MLVAFEGIDGSGKSTAARAVARRLRAAGHPVVLTREPTATVLGRAVRDGIRSRTDAVRLAGLVLADRAAHAVVLEELLRRKGLVLTDRYVDSTTAYQAVTLAGRVPAPLQTLRRVQELLFPVPEVVFLLDLAPERALGRLGGRRVREPFERAAFLRRVRANYLRLSRAAPRQWVRLDATHPARELAEDITSRIRRRLVQG